MTTKKDEKINHSIIYGQSDDNIYCCGDFNAQGGEYNSDKKKNGILWMLSDGSILEIKYGMRIPGVWGIEVIKAGFLYEFLKRCPSDDEAMYSDVAFFKKGLMWVFQCSPEQWQQVSEVSLYLDKCTRNILDSVEVEVNNV